MKIRDQASAARRSARKRETVKMGVIVWLDELQGALKGPAARKIIRQGALQDAPS